MKPGIANAFLIGFIESMADFGNPLVLGGSHGVLSTEIFFAVVGSQNDPSRAAACWRSSCSLHADGISGPARWLSGKNFATVTGKGDSGVAYRPAPRLSIAVHAIVIPWMIFTIVIYGMILIGGFVKTWGLDNTLTLEHYAPRLLRRNGAMGHLLDWRCLELVLDDDRDRADFGAADGGRRPADGLSHSPPEICRPQCVRIRADDELRHSRHGASASATSWPSTCRRWK
jgi:hypothetical protein